MNYKEYLQSRKYRRKTLEAYLHYNEVFLKWLSRENLTIESCHYADLLNFVKELKATERSLSNLNAHIRGVKYFYEYLQATGAVKHNPAKRLHVRGRSLQLPSDLLSEQELDNFYQQHPETSMPQKRNKAILGLVIYQGLQEREIFNLETSDINIEKGTITIRASGRSNTRVLKLKASQILLMQQYKSGILTRVKQQNIKSITNQLSSYLKKRYSKFKNLLHLRTSVISHWTEEKNIREVQYMAGHKNLVSTEVYRQVNLKDLKKALDEYHPLK